MMVNIVIDNKCEISIIIVRWNEFHNFVLYISMLGQVRNLIEIKLKSYAITFQFLVLIEWIEKLYIRMYLISLFLYNKRNINVKDP